MRIKDQNFLYKIRVMFVGSVTHQAGLTKRFNRLDFL